MYYYGGTGAMTGATTWYVWRLNSLYDFDYTATGK